MFVWMRQFKRIIHLFEEFKIFSRKMICLNMKIKRKLKLRNFKKVFHIIKIVKFEIHLIKKEIEFPQVELFIG